MQQPSARVAFLLATAAGLVLASVASAQYRVDNSNARDANNRLGSGGVNAPGTNAGGLRPNYVVTGNVTAGREFRGSLGYTDPNAFRGNLGSSSFDSFVRSSSGFQGGRAQFNANNTQAFFGSGTVQAPVGFQRSGATGFVANASPVANPFDARIDYGGVGRAVIVQSLPSQVQALRSTPTLGAPSGIFAPTQLAAPDAQPFAQRVRLSEYTVIRRPDVVRNELPGVITTPNLAPPTLTPTGQDPASTVNPSVISVPQVSPLGSPNAIPSVPATGQGRQRTVQLEKGGVKPTFQAYQNAQLESLRARFSQFRPQLADQPAFAADAAQREANNEALRRAAKARAEAAAGAPTDGSTPTPPAATSDTPVNIPAATGNVMPSPVDSATPEPAKIGGPILIKSFADGIDNKPLADAVRAAEAVLQAGKYSDAALEFAKAEQLAGGSDPLIYTGSAVAELGFGRYRIAEAKLRTAYTAEPSLMLAQFDLRSLFGEQRLALQITELKEISKVEPNDPGPLLLLGFLYYNTGNEAFAKDHLRRALEITGGDDQQVKALLNTWEKTEQSK
jgi:tetratricopeptide (TPR) repeat protein